MPSFQRFLPFIRKRYTENQRVTTNPELVGRNHSAAEKFANP